MVNNKFRAWDRFTKKMFIVGFSILGETTCFDLIGQYCNENPNGDTPTLFRMNDIVIMQFIGKKDIHGIDIYHGDVVRPPIDTNETDVAKIYYTHDIVIWNNDRGQWVLENNQDNVIFDSQYEIIGNIYENPELC